MAFLTTVEQKEALESEQPHVIALLDPDGNVNLGIEEGKPYSWTGNAGQSYVLKYSLDDVDLHSLSSTHGSNFQSLTSVQSKISSVLSLISSVANITFQDVTGIVNETPNLTIVSADIAPPNAPAATVLDVNSTTQTINAANIFMSSAFTQNYGDEDDDATRILLHEVLHAIGVTHPKDSESGPLGLNSGFHPDFDQSETVMSYNANLAINNGDLHYSPSTLMPYDIAALQYLYGVNTDFNDGNTTYTINGPDGNGDYYDSPVDISDSKDDTSTLKGHTTTIWDAAGVDEVVVQADVTQNVRVDLRAGNAVNEDQERFGVDSGDLYNFADDELQYNEGDVYSSKIGNDETGFKIIANAFPFGGANGEGMLDNATGAKGNDVIYGNNLDNILKGEEGNDAIFGFDGDDTIFGGEGTDKLFGGEGQDTLDYSLNPERGSANNDGIIFTQDSQNLDKATVVDGWGDTDTVEGFETVKGSNYNDEFILHSSTGTTYNGGTGVNNASYTKAYQNLKDGSFVTKESSKADTFINVEVAPSVSAEQYTYLIESFSTSSSFTSAAMLGVDGNGDDFVNFTGDGAGVDYSTVDTSIDFAFGELSPGYNGDYSAVYGNVTHENIYGAISVQGSQFGDSYTIGGSVMKTPNAGQFAIYSGLGNDTVTVDQTGNLRDYLYEYRGGDDEVTLGYTSTQGLKFSLWSGISNSDITNINVFNVSVNGIHTIYSVEVTFDLNNGNGSNTLTIKDLSSVTHGNLILTLHNGNYYEVTPTSGYTYNVVNAQEPEVAEDVLGTFGDDVLEAQDTQSIYAMGGDDTVIVSKGDISIYGGAGHNVVDFSNITTATTVDLEAGTITHDDGSVTQINDFQDVILGSGDNTVNGSSGSDSIYIGSGPNTIFAGDGDDIIHMTANNAADYVDGGAGYDTASYATVTENLTIDLGNQTVSGNNLGQDDLIDIENIQSGLGNDLIFGSYGNDEIDLLGGADVVFAYDGDDVITVSNSDTFNVDGGLGNDLISFENSDYAIVDLSNGSAINSGTSATLSNIENVAGTNSDDTLTGNSGDNTLYGAGGNDVLNGGDGDDTVFGDDGDDRFIYTMNGVTTGGDDTYHGGAGVDTLDFSAMEVAAWANLDITNESAWTQDAADLSSGTWRKIADFDGMENVITTAYGDYVKGSSGDNVVTYTMDGLLTGGMDQYYGEGGSDTLDFSQMDAAVWASLDANDLDAWTQDAVDLSSGTWRKILNFDGFENINASIYGDYIKGDTGDNIFKYAMDGLNTGGFDQYDGQGGADTASFSMADAAVHVDLNSSTEAWTKDDFDLATGSWRAIANLTDIENVEGSDYDDFLQGEAGNNVLAGGLGADRLKGLDGNDTLDGGAGSDELVGGNGADTFVLGDLASVDIVEDFNTGQGDALDLSDILAGYDPLVDALTDFVQITDSGNDSVVSVDADGGADNFVQIATLWNVNGLTDEAALEASGNLIAA